jgi:hypothetical protein
MEKQIFHINHANHIRIQSKKIGIGTYRTALQDIKEIAADTVVVGISVTRIQGTTLKGVGGATLVSDDVFNNSYLTLKTRGSNEFVSNLSLLEIEKATNRTEAACMAITRADIDFSRSEIICEDKAAYDANTDAVYEFGVWFIHKDKLNIVF